MDLRQLKVLLVEDERVIREILLRMLASIGVTDVTDVSSAESAWENLTGDKRKPFHVIITDLTLPGASGGVLIKMLREMPSPRAKTLPVIVLTGDNNPTTYKKLEASGISSYLIKPVSADLLRSAIERALTTPSVAAK